MFLTVQWLSVAVQWLSASDQWLSVVCQFLVDGSPTYFPNSKKVFGGNKLCPKIYVEGPDFLGWFGGMFWTVSGRSMPVSGQSMPVDARRCPSVVISGYQLPVSFLSIAPNLLSKLEKSV